MIPAPSAFGWIASAKRSGRPYRGGMQVDQRSLSGGCNLSDVPLNGSIPVSRTTLKAWMPVEDGGHQADPYLRLGIDPEEAVYEPDVIRIEFFTVFRPVMRIGIVEAEMDNDEVGLEVQCFLIFFLLQIRSVSVTEKCSTGMPEIPYLVAAAQHPLQLGWITVFLPVGYRHAPCDTVSHTSHLDGTAGNCRQHRQEQSEQHDSSLLLHHSVAIVSVVLTFKGILHRAAKLTIFCE